MAGETWASLGGVWVPEFGSGVAPPSDAPSDAPRARVTHDSNRLRTPRHCPSPLPPHTPLHTHPPHKETSSPPKPSSQLRANHKSVPNRQRKGAGLLYGLALRAPTSRRRRDPRIIEIREIRLRHGLRHRKCWPRHSVIASHTVILRVGRFKPSPNAEAWRLRRKRQGEGRRQNRAKTVIHAALDRDM